MIDKMCREYGLYLAMLFGVLAIQVVFSYGHLESTEELGIHPKRENLQEKVNFFEKMAMPSARINMPLALFGAAAAIAGIFGLGIVADVIFAMKWFSAKGLGISFGASSAGDLGPWEVEDLFKLFVIFFFMISCLHALLYAVLSAHWISMGVLQNISLVAGTAGLYAVVLITLVAWRRKMYPMASVVSMPGWSNIGAAVGNGVVAYVAFIPPLVALMCLSLLACQWIGVEPEPHPIVEILQHEKNLLRLMYLGMLTVFVGPLVEEIIFRGMAYSALRKRLGVAAAAASSALLFAIAHTNVAQTLPVFGMGFVLAVLYETTGNLGASIVFHMINNTLAFVLTLFVLFWMK